MSLTGSPWTKFLDKQHYDPYSLYKDQVSFKIDEIITSIGNELMKSNQSLLETEEKYTQETARKMAIHLVMETLLKLQYEYSPQALAAMSVALLADLPNLEEFRTSISNNSFLTKEESEVKNNFNDETPTHLTIEKKPSLFSKILGFF